MDIFVKYNRNKLGDRQIDTLIGLSKGILANDDVDQKEAEFLQKWLQQNTQSEHPIIINLLDRVSSMLSDGVLDNDESEELFNILKSISGEESEFGELGKTTSLPLCNPFPNIQFEGSLFCFTGTFAYGPRKKCIEYLEGKGGSFNSKVIKKTDYLVIGAYVTDSWAHESFGRKIEQAMLNREHGTGIKIINEEWFLSN